jgi:hypothetical protein
LQRGDAEKAVEALQRATHYEMGAPRLLIGAMYPIYVRGEAFLAEGRGAEAAAEFQKILDHRGIIVSDPVGALAWQTSLSKQRHQSRKGRNNPEPGTAVPGKGWGKDRVPEGTTQDYIRPITLVGSSTLTPNSLQRRR